MPLTADTPSDLERTTGFEPATPPWQGLRLRSSDLPFQLATKVDLLKRVSEGWRFPGCYGQFESFYPQTAPKRLPRHSSLATGCQFLTVSQSGARARSALRRPVSSR